MENRFHTLDSMRGVAALAVVVFHLGVVMHLYALPHAYLAVDFFFLLSGFVLGRAYEAKLKRSLSARNFIAMRLVRLYPMFALGVAIGAVMMAGRILTHSQRAMPLPDTLLTLVLNAIMLPAINSKDVLFPPNEPAWSLFFELVINVAFAIAIFRFKSRFLAIFCCLVGGLFLYEMAIFGDSEGGPTWQLMPLGLLRVGFSFPLGVLMARCDIFKRRSLISLIPIAALGFIFVGTVEWYDWRYNSVAVFIAMPVILWFGATFELPKVLQRLGSVLGDASYPLYAVHYPLLQIFAYVFVRRLHLAPIPLAVVFVVGVSLFSWLLALYVDAPVRKWISRRLALGVTAMPVELANS